MYLFVTIKTRDYFKHLTMKTSDVHTRLIVTSEFRFIQNGMRLLLLFIFSISFNGLYAQQKEVNQQVLEQRLVEIDDLVQKIDETTTRINVRIAGVPTENVDPSVLVQLNDLQIQKDQFIREKISIEFSLGITSSEPIQLIEIPESTFLQLPQQNQDQILAHPEKYVVIENI